MGGKKGTRNLWNMRIEYFFMTEMETIPLKYPLSRPTKHLRVVGNFFMICSAFGQSKIEHPKYRIIRGTYYQLDHTWGNLDIKGNFPRTFSVSSSTILPRVNNLNF
jgi:hypothetical protein